jgi:phosphatidylglycerol:prolipoprotein diacylglycerol transferase
MSFPVFIPLGPVKLHPHVLFDFLAYFLGAQLYFRTRRPGRLTGEQSLAVVAGAIIGALIGATALSWFQNPQDWRDPGISLHYILFPGRTVVGGLLGGLIGVELAKAIVKLQASTGDDLVFPILAGMVLGRVGCFLTGVTDNTVGLPTTLPLGIDMGDGIARHPTSLYEIAFLGLLAALLWKRRARPHEEGDLFRLFLSAYLAFRFVIEFLKPNPRPFLGVSAIQLACVAGLTYYAPFLRQLFTARHNEPAYAR